MTTQDGRQDAVSRCCPEAASSSDGGCCAGGVGSDRTPGYLFGQTREKLSSRLARLLRRTADALETWAQSSVDSRNNPAREAESAQPDRVRDAVATSYAKAVASSAGTCCGGGPVPKGVAANLAGYTGEELGVLPDHAVVNSFGCGNPLAFAGVKDGDVVLDLGSGAGIDILIAGKMVGPTGRAIGVDMTDEMIARANENIRAAGLDNTEVRKGIIEKLPVESGSVDWVISNCVINLSPEKDKVFSEIHRVLKPGGRVSISDIVVQDLPDWIRSDQALYSSCIAGAISEEEYLAGLQRAGLCDVQVTERLVYDETQLAAFAQSEELAEAVGACCGGGPPSELARRVAAETTGKIWSAKFVATKPSSA